MKGIPAHWPVNSVGKDIFCDDDAFDKDNLKMFQIGTISRGISSGCGLLTLHTLDSGCGGNLCGFYHAVAGSWRARQVSVAVAGTSLWNSSGLISTASFINS
jgi:hypothetical protein